MPSYAVIFRTHVWDDGIAGLARRARACCGSGSFAIAADESNGPLQLDDFVKISHTGDFSDYGLPNTPDGHVLWWNADYVLYAAQRSLPGYDYYVMLEYDVLMNCDLDRMIEQCASNNVDLVAQDIRRIASGDHWSGASASEMGPDLWWALIPLVIVSARAIDVMLQTRRTLAAELAAGRISHWPYCEPFLPTAIAQEPSTTTWPLDRLVDSHMLQFRPVINVRDPRLALSEIVAHPVMSGARFIKAFIAHNPPGSHHMTDGRLRAELQQERFDDLRAALGDQLRVEPNPDGTWSVASSVVPSDPEIFRPWVDLAYAKPATQSSCSPWSRGISAEEDASAANRDPAPDDYAFHTEGEDSPWWQVYLMETCVVERIEIVNRVSIPLRFIHFRVDVSMDGIEWTTCLTKLDNAIVSSDLEHPAVFMLEHQVRARYARIVQLDRGVLHLRRVRILGFRLPHAISAAAAADRRETLADLLAKPSDRETLATAVETLVHQRVFGRGYESYDLNKLGGFAAGVDSCLYAAAHMQDAQRFPDAGTLHDYAASCTPASGMVLEFGVFSGTSINRIASQMPGRRIYGFDSFEGLPETWRQDFGQGTFKRTDLPAVLGNVELVVGWFDNTLPSFVADRPEEKLALLHVDCDLYSSTKTIFANVFDRIEAGTVIVFDEYFNYPEWRLHEFKAFQEFTAEHRLSYEYIGWVPTNQQVAVRVTSVA